MRYSHEADILPVWWFQSACLSVGVTAVSWPSALCLVCYCPVLGWVEWRLFGFVCSTNSRYCFFVSSFLGFSFVWVLHEYLVFLVLRTEPRSGFLFLCFWCLFWHVAALKWGCKCVSLLGGVAVFPSGTFCVLHRIGVFHVLARLSLISITVWMSIGYCFPLASGVVSVCFRKTASDNPLVHKAHCIANRYTRLENLAWSNSVFYRFMKPLLLSSVNTFCSINFQFSTIPKFYVQNHTRIFMFWIVSELFGLFILVLHVSLFMTVRCEPGHGWGLTDSGTN